MKRKLAHLGLVAVVSILGLARAARAGTFDPVDLALGQLTGQSSTIYGDDSSIAVDGEDGGDWSVGTATLTDEDYHSWWEVDLGQSRHIGTIEIQQRTDCCQDNIFPFVVIVSDFPIIDTDITDADGQTFPGITRIVVGDVVEGKYIVPVHRTGEYVRIALLREYTSLSLGEVKVLEEWNAALGRGFSAPTPQNVPSSRAVDGNVDGAFADGSVALVNAGGGGSINFEVPRPIDTVDVWSDNTDCCSKVFPRPTFTLTASLKGKQVFKQSGITQAIPATVHLGGLMIDAFGVKLDKSDIFSIAEIQAWPVAHGTDGSFPSLSSKNGNSTDPFSAIDFNLNAAGNDVNQLDARTAFQTDPYYDLDLGSDRYLETIKLWGEADLSSTATYSVWVSEFTPFPVGATVQQLRENQINTGQIEWLNVGTGADSTTGINTRARYIRIAIQGANQQLGFRELEVNTTESFSQFPTDGDVTNKRPTTLSAGGGSTRPNTPVDLYVFTPNANSGAGFLDNYTYVGSAISGTKADLENDAVAPMYHWEMTYEAPFPPSAWQAGGVLGVYAQEYVNPGPFPIATPLQTNSIRAGYAGSIATVEPDLFWPHARWAANDLMPDTKATPPPYLAFPMGTSLNASYYNLHKSGTYVEMPATLAAFNSQYGLGSGAVNVKYYNSGDLGIGRNMTCKRTSWKANGASETGLACAVSNYAPASAAGSKAPVQFGQESAAVSLLKGGAPPFATVVMVKRDNQPTTMFGVYQPIAPATTDPSKTKLIQTPVALDATAFNTSVPNNCVACHGGSAGGDPLSLTATTAFLPFDPGAIGAEGTGYDWPSQEDKFRQLNNLILQSGATPAVADFINGTYHSKAGTSGTKADPSYVPVGWAHSAAQQKAYTSFVKPNCRGCHMSQVANTNKGVDMLKASDLEALRVNILSDVCVTHVMPHSQVTNRRAWSSEARATMLSYFGRDDYDTSNTSFEACKP